MPINFVQSGTIHTVSKVVYNGTELRKLVLNGTTIFEVASSNIKITALPTYLGSRTVSLSGSIDIANALITLVYGSTSTTVYADSSGNWSTSVNVASDGYFTFTASYNGESSSTSTTIDTDVPTVVLSGVIYSGVIEPYVNVTLSSAATVALTTSHFSTSAGSIKRIIKDTDTAYRIEFNGSFTRGASITVTAVSGLIVRASGTTNAQVSNTYTATSMPVYGNLDSATLSGSVLTVTGWSAMTAYGLCNVTDTVEITVTDVGSGWTASFTRYPSGTYRSDVQNKADVIATCYASNSGYYGWSLTHDFGTTTAGRTYNVTAKAAPQIGEPAVSIAGTVQVRT